MIGEEGRAGWDGMGHRRVLDDAGRFVGGGGGAWPELALHGSSARDGNGSGFGFVQGSFTPWELTQAGRRQHRPSNIIQSSRRKRYTRTRGTVSLVGIHGFSMSFGLYAWQAH